MGSAGGVIGRSGHEWNAQPKLANPHLGNRSADGSYVTRAGEGCMSEAVSTVWVVLDDAGQVVVRAGGADAPAFAAEWAERGARVVELRNGSVAAA